jgi:hypothetical protein
VVVHPLTQPFAQTQDRLRVIQSAFRFIHE